MDDQKEPFWWREKLSKRKRFTSFVKDMIDDALYFAEKFSIDFLEFIDAKVGIGKFIIGIVIIGMVGLVQFVRHLPPPVEISQSQSDRAEIRASRARAIETLMATKTFVVNGKEVQVTDETRERLKAMLQDGR